MTQIATTAQTETEEFDLPEDGFTTRMAANLAALAPAWNAATAEVLAAEKAEDEARRAKRRARRKA
ncbi:hypothetical protein ACQKJ1_26315 [Methylorubrum rhodesianum]|uniref:hypothetical protein n=1 Tax=Methylorubrum rhodesianum TaxID=29427 RepID=UPI003D04CF5B